MVASALRRPPPTGLHGLPATAPVVLGNPPRPTRTAPAAHRVDGCPRQTPHRPCDAPPPATPIPVCSPQAGRRDEDAVGVSGRPTLRRAGTSRVMAGRPLSDTRDRHEERGGKAARRQCRIVHCRGRHQRAGPRRRCADRARHPRGWPRRTPRAHPVCVRGKGRRTHPRRSTRDAHHRLTSGACGGTERRQGRCRRRGDGRSSW